MITDPATREMSLKPGDLVAGKYRISRLLGVGGMGAVFAAKHIHLDETVAIKVLHPEVLCNSEVVTRFAREARAAAKIKSEHVARVYDVGTLEAGPPYMVLEYLEGEDLENLLTRGGAFQVEDAVGYVLQACEAIAEAHSHGIVHRDLKPANLFRVRCADGSYSIKVLDFGISKLMGDAKFQDMAMTKTATVMGSPLYMSPEQLGSARDVDERSDVWSIGIILYELISGSAPFSGTSFSELCINIVTSPLPPMDSKKRQIPPALVRTVAKCLEKERINRYRDIGELAADLAPVASSRAMLSVERIIGVLDRSRVALGATKPTMTEPSTAREPDSDTVNPWGRTKPTSGPRRSRLLYILSAMLFTVGAILTVAVLGRTPNAAKSQLSATAPGTVAAPSRELLSNQQELRATPDAGVPTSPPEIPDARAERQIPLVEVALSKRETIAEPQRPTNPNARSQRRVNANSRLESSDTDSDLVEGQRAAGSWSRKVQDRPSRPTSSAESNLPPTHPPKTRSVYEDRK